MSLGDLRRGFLTPAEGSIYFAMSEREVNCPSTLQSTMLCPYDRTRSHLAFVVFTSSVFIKPLSVLATGNRGQVWGSTTPFQVLHWGTHGPFVQQEWYGRPTVNNVIVLVWEAFFRPPGIVA